MISLHRKVEALLNDFIQSSSYSAEWFKVATNPQGVFRLKPGQIIPVAQLTFIGNAPGFVAPFRKLEASHRTVGAITEYLSGKSLEDEERAIQPIISIDFVTDPLFIKAAKQGQTTIDESQITQPSLLFSIPAHLLFSPKHFICALPTYFWAWWLLSK